MSINVICKFCGKTMIIPIPTQGSHRRVYCSEECLKQGNQKRQSTRRRECNLQSRLGLSGGAIGAINEQVVAIDLIKRGWKVYTAFEPTHPFDILAIRGKHMLRIEVKTETVLPSGYSFVGNKRSQDGKYDILAKVRNLADITYSPELPL